MMTILKMLPVLLMIVLAGCKKDKSASKPIAASELENYYLVGQVSGVDRKLVLIDFTKDGNLTKANLHIRGTLRIINTTIVDSKFVFDFDLNGVDVFTFELQKDANGSIGLKNYKFVRSSNANLGLEYAKLYKKSAMPGYLNASYKIDNLLFKLNGSNELEWDIKLRQNGSFLTLLPAFKRNFYSLNLGIKTTNDQFFGVSVPDWKGGNAPFLLLDFNDVLYQGVKQ